MTHAFLDKMDGFYRRSLKDNVCHFIDFSIVEEMFTIYLGNLRLISNDIIQELLETFVEKLDEKMIFNRVNGI